MRRWTLWAVMYLCILFLGGIDNAAAQFPTGTLAPRLDLSVRSEGVGRASSMLFWGDHPSSRANPALLGYEHGVRYEDGGTKDDTDTAHRFSFEDSHLILAAYGVGLSLSGKPSEGLGGSTVEYPRVTAVDEQGIERGTFMPREEMRAWSLGVNLVELTEHLLRVSGRTLHPIHRYGDLSLGIAARSVDVSLAPKEFTMDGQEGKGEVDTRNRGLLIRVTPYNSVDASGWLPSLDPKLDSFLGGIRLDVAHGRSLLNYNNATISYIDPDQEDPIPRISRKGWTIHAATGFPGVIRKRAQNKTFAWIMGSLTPLFSWGRLWDRSQAKVGDNGWKEEERNYSGWELSLANIYTIRRGHVDEGTGGLNGDTSGWGLGFHIFDLGFFRYDESTSVPADNHPGIRRNGWTAGIDLLAGWNRLRR